MSDDRCASDVEAPSEGPKPEGVSRAKNGARQKREDEESDKVSLGH